MQLVRWVLIVAFLPLAAFGLLNILMPATTIGWQNRVTAKRTTGNRKDVVGLAFQRALGQTTTDGRNEPRVLKRVRLLGLFEVAIAALVIVLAVAHT
ncbi:MAG: hypothetical protein QOI44_2621 [Actinomycetota bacterium]|nr:hypothetical protein [Actinomycetota bacterium]